MDPKRLTRSTPLEHRTGLTARSGSLKRSALKRSRWRRPPRAAAAVAADRGAALAREARERELQLEFEREVLKRARFRCQVCDAPDGHLEAHHVISQQELRRIAATLGIDELDLLWDPDNGMAVCGRFSAKRCHANHTGAHRRIPRAKIPARARAYATRLNRSWWIERYYPA